MTEFEMLVCYGAGIAAALTAFLAFELAAPALIWWWLRR